MGKTTIADIGKLAGLSSATVDRALNGRAGVSPANRQRVLQAAKELGYLPSEGTVHLPSRPAHLEFLIPFGQNAFMRDVTNSITEFAARLPLVATCNIIPLNGIDPEDLVGGLESMSLRTEGVGLIAIDHPKTRHAIRQLVDSGVRVVTIASDVLSTTRSAYVGVDNRIAGRTAAQLMGLMAGQASGSVALFVGSRAFHGHQERESGFRSFLQEHCPQLKILSVIETGEDSKRSRALATGILNSTEDLVGMYCVGAGRKGIVDALDGRTSGQRPFVIMHDLTDNSQLWLTNDLIDV
ncbi:MAG: LacI family DNA-binding transcriptional regulator, partial [Silicimonas sp.]|nr:LacI family DNA-binding transcriptional regulator [Silicimonas sp.]